MLYIVATPIGNIEDITLRALNILREVDVVAAEDTRRTLALLSHYQIKKPLISYYEHNKFSRGQELIRRLQQGENIALVSDAGTPGISDPGADLVKLCIENGIEVSMAPGACAGIMALVLSGLDTDRFVFEGFYGRSNKEIKDFCNRISKRELTTIVYEAPHRLVKTLEELRGVLGDRTIAVCRELTKKFEEVRRGNAAEHLQYYAENPPRGEFILVIEGASGEQQDQPESLAIDKLCERIDALINQGVKKNEAVKTAASEAGIRRNQAYEIYLEYQNK